MFSNKIGFHLKQNGYMKKNALLMTMFWFISRIANPSISFHFRNHFSVSNNRAKYNVSYFCESVSNS